MDKSYEERMRALLHEESDRYLSVYEGDILLLAREADAEIARLKAALEAAELAMRVSEQIFKTYCEMLQSYVKDGVGAEAAIERLGPWTREQCEKFNAAQRHVLDALATRADKSLAEMEAK